MTQYNNILEAIGHTPLVKLNKVAAQVKSSIYVKPEFLKTPDARPKTIEPRGRVTGYKGVQKAVFLFFCLIWGGL